MDFPLQPYDFLMLAVLVLSALFGAWKGMAWQLAALASLVVSSVVALRFSSVLMVYISLPVPWNRCVAMLLLAVGTSMAIWVIFRFVSRVIDRVRLKEFDRQVGALFGLAKGVLWCVVITFFAVTLSTTGREKVLGTYSGYYTAVLIHRAGPVLPDEVRDVLGRYIDHSRGRWTEEELAPADQPEEPVPASLNSGQ